MRAVERARAQSIVWVLLVAIAFAFSGGAAALEEHDIAPIPVPRGAEPQAIQLSLQDCILLVLENNLEIVVARFEPKIREAEIVGARAEFDPSVDFGIDFDRSVTATAFRVGMITQSFGLDEKTLTMSAGVRSKILTGSEVSVDVQAVRLETNSVFATLVPSYTTNVVLTVSQPLLQGFGPGFNLSNITLANNNRDISELDFQQSVAQTVADVQTTYWELVFSIENLKVAQTSLQRAKRFLRETRARVEVGVLAPVEILASEAEVAARQEAVIVAEGAVSDVEDRLTRLIIPASRPELWELGIIPTDEPRFVPSPISLQESLGKAFDKRWDYRKAKIDLENRHIQVKVAKNSLLPRVDLRGSFGLNGLSGSSAIPGIASPVQGDYGESFHQMFTGDFYQLGAGLVVEYPLGNRLARSELTKRRLEVLQGLASLKNLEVGIEVEVRNAVRQVGIDVNRVRATRKARELAVEKLRAEEKKFEVGISTAFNVLEFQEDLAQAQRNELRAITDYNESLVQLDLVRGVINEVNLIGFERT